MIIKLFKYLFEHTYEIHYLINPGSWTIYEEIYTCKAYSKYQAHIKFYNNTLNNNNHYSDVSVRRSFLAMKEHIFKTKEK